MSKKDGWFDPKYNIDRKSKSISASGQFKQKKQNTQTYTNETASREQTKTPSLERNRPAKNLRHIALLEKALEGIIFEEAGLNLLKDKIGVLKDEGCENNNIRKLKELIFSQRLAILQKIIKVLKYYEQKFASTNFDSKEILRLKTEIQEKNDLLEEWGHRVQKTWNKIFSQNDKLNIDSIDIETC